MALLSGQLGWVHLRLWGRTRFCRFAYIWLVVVPIAAKLLLPVAGTHEFHFLGKARTIEIGLPFSWLGFYMAAVAFTIAQGLYSWKCPPIVKSFVDFAAYRAVHRGNHYLTESLSQVGPALDSHHFEALNLQVYQTLKPTSQLIEYTPSPDKAQEEEHRNALILRWQETLANTSSDADISDLFSITISQASTTRQTWMWLSLAFFVVGTGIILFLLGQNFVAVIQLALR